MTMTHRPPTPPPPAHARQIVPDIASHFHPPASWPEAMQPLHMLCVGAYFTFLEADGYADTLRRDQGDSPTVALWSAHALRAYDLWREIEADAQATLAALLRSDDQSRAVAQEGASDDD